MARKFAVIGLGRFGQQLAIALHAADAEVIAVDRTTKAVEAVRDHVTLAVRLDSTDEEAIKAQGIHEVDVAIVGIGNELESAAVTVAVLNELGVKRIIARAETEMQRRIMERIGATDTVSPERESALRWAHRLMLPSLHKYVALGRDHSIVSVTAPKTFHGKPLRALDLRNAFGVNLIAIERGAGEPSTGKNAEDAKTKGVGPGTIEIPGAATVVLSGDVLIFVGTNDALSRMPQD